MHVCMLANARLALTVAEHAKTAFEAHAHVVVDDLPELDVVVVGQFDRVTTLQTSSCRCSESFEKGYGVGCGGGRKGVTKGWAC